MAVSDWSADAKQNVELGKYKLNGEFGAMFAELMAQIKASKEEEEAIIGAWTDETETTTVKGAIEALREG